MSSDKFAADLLAARDRRHAALVAVLGEAAPATLFVSLNIPGPDKAPPGALPVFAWALRAARQNFPGLALRVEADDALGPYAIATLAAPPRNAKLRCLRIEASHPVARLLDLDIHSADARPVDRKSLGLSPRPCLLCAQPAVDCMRARRHPYPELIARAHELFATFAA